MSGWEYVAAGLGLAYVLLAMKQSLWCWPAAFVSTIIYTLLFWRGALFMESLLNFYYLLMAVYGYMQWRKRPADKSHGATQHTYIVSWSWQKHLKWIGIATIISIVLGYVMDTYTPAKLAYLDTFTTVFAVMTTYLVTQKILENWLYWVAIDLASIYLYWQQGYLATLVLFILYTAIALQGYLVWRKELQQSTPSMVASH